MGGLLLILRLALAAVFAVAAAGKLADRSGTRSAVTAFGAPERLAGPAALLIPVAEIAVALSLLWPGTTAAGSIGALALLAVFSAAIAFNLARGRTPECHCFGQVHSEPIGAATLARNAVLAALAIAVLVLGGDGYGPGAVSWADAPSALLGAALALAAGVAVAFTLMRRYGRSLRRIDELEEALLTAGLEVPEDAEPPVLPIGSPAPRFDGLDEILAGRRPLLLVFTAEGCGPCDELRPKIATWGEEHADLLAFSEVSYDDHEELAESYGANATPAAILLGADGSVESRVHHGGGEVEALVEEALAMHAPPPPGPGDPLPELWLAELDEPGERVELSSRLAPDRETLILFWSPDCGYCSAMRDDLRDVDAGLAAGPALVVVSAGDAEDVAAEGFESPVLWDPDSTVSFALGAGGTPTAILVGPDRAIASEVAGGKDAVLALAGASSQLDLTVVAGGNGEPSGGI